MDTPTIRCLNNTASESAAMHVWIYPKLDPRDLDRFKHIPIFRHFLGYDHAK